MRFKWGLRCAAAVALVGLCGPVVAAGAPPPIPSFDPGARQDRLLRDERYYEERRESELRDRDVPVIEGPAPGGEGGLPETGTRFLLRGVRFNPSSFMDAETLREIARDYVGRQISFADINDMVGRINAIYAERGIVTARAIVPPQTVSGGILAVRLVEGRLGELTLEGNRYTRDSFIRGRLPLAPGQVIDIPELRDSLLYLNSTTDLRVGASMRAGEATGESDVVLSVDEPPRYRVRLFADNNGADTTGEYRGGVVANVYAPLGYDDRLTVLAVGAEGAANGAISYRFPFNAYGGGVELSYAQGDIQVTNGPFSDLDINGNSRQLSLALDQPFLRRERLWLDGYLQGSQIESSTDISDVPLSEYDILRLESGLSLTGFGQRHQWSLRQGVAHAQVQNVFDESNGYWLFDGDASFSLLFTERLIGVARGGWQYADEPTIPSPLLFQIGGVSTVRGYPQGALAGARGYFLSLESQYRWRAGLIPFAFVDHGLVDDVSPDRETISSVGVGLRWQYGDYLSGEIAWGQALEQVLPDQDNGRLHVRISLIWPGY